MSEPRPIRAGLTCRYSPACRQCGACRLAMIGFSLLLTAACGQVQGQAGGDQALVPRMEAEAVVAADGYRLPLSRWLPEGEPCQVVLGLHGFNDFRDTFASLASEWRDDCIAFYAYDQRGFGATVGRGLWPGQTRLVNDAIVVAELLRARYPATPLYLLGESMGGAVALLAMAQAHPPPVDGAVLMAPAVWARDIQPWYQRLALWLGMRVMPGVRLASDWVDIDPSDDPDVLEYWRSHPLVIRHTRVDALAGVTRLMDAALATAERVDYPALLLYGGEDEVIPPEAICALLQRLPDKPAAAWRFVYYPQGYHMLTRYSDAAITREDIRAWLRSTNATLPSGSELQPARARTRLCQA